MPLHFISSAWQPAEKAAKCWNETTPLINSELHSRVYGTGFSELGHPCNYFHSCIYTVLFKVITTNLCRGWNWKLFFIFFAYLDSYSINGGSGENAFGRKSLGQELRVNNVSPDFTVQHGNRALATKDMRKSQGMLWCLSNNSLYMCGSFHRSPFFFSRLLRIGFP